MAAHLHDSVLHTLALIQRADAPPEVVSLARRQERELRAWLNGRVADDGQESLGAAVDGLAARVEREHAVAVDAVVVGDRPVDERLRAVVLACQAATAVRRAPAERVEAGERRARVPWPSRLRPSSIPSACRRRGCTPWLGRPMPCCD